MTTALRKIQFAPESTNGTAVTTTEIWRGLGLMNDERERKRVDENVGIATPTLRYYTPKLGGSLALDPVEATFQQIYHIFEAGIAGVTPVQDGSGSGYIRAYQAPQGTIPDVNAYTIQQGDETMVAQMDYCFVESFTITGNASEGVMMSANWIGRNYDSGASFDGGATTPVLLPSDHIVFGGSNLYIDDDDGTIGTTLVSNTLLSFELSVTTGWKAKYTNESKDFDFIYFDKGSFEATLSVVFEENATAVSERSDYEDDVTRLIRLEFEGTALQTAGTTYSNKTLYLDSAGQYTEMPLGDVDGNATFEAELDIAHDLISGLSLGATVVNEIS